VRESLLNWDLRPMPRIAEDPASGCGKLVEIDRKLTITIFPEYFGRFVRQARQAIEMKSALTHGECQGYIHR